ncbi:unnamed protein product [Schistosoma curassoni]|uniref:Uncharacterized protein n=1 Tax=Schistosoma curassoni TaxID=6186 RepID=A0A183JKN8_9TREM|nr:unnamed protein product [Schistosoma curassoni]
MDNTGYEDIIGRHGVGREKQKWGEACEPICIQQTGYRRHNIPTQTHTQRFVGLTRSQHKEPDRSMEDLRTRRGADIASDHNQLVVAKMKLKVKKHSKTGKTALQRFNIPFLRHTVKLSQFNIALNNRFQALQDIQEEETTMGDNWKGIKETLTSTC